MKQKRDWIAWLLEKVVLFLERHFAPRKRRP